jgi:biopolymer transport protein ExbD
MEGTTKITLRSRKKARIEIIPLIDVIFFLLATFVLFTLSLNRIQSVDVTLPSTVPNPLPPPPGDTTVTLQISGDGTLFWNHEPIDMNELGPRIASYISTVQEADRRILVASDDRAHFGDAVAVLDKIREAGITQYSVETTTRITGR